MYSAWRSGRLFASHTIRGHRSSRLGCLSPRQCKHPQFRARRGTDGLLREFHWTTQAPERLSVERRGSRPTDTGPLREVLPVLFQNFDRQVKNRPGKAPRGISLRSWGGWGGGRTPVTWATCPPSPGAAPQPWAAVSARAAGGVLADGPRRPRPVRLRHRDRLRGQRDRRRPQTRRVPARGTL